jgi:SHS2 domain-containing protein
MSSSSDKDYEILEHTADIGIKVSGKSLAEVFRKAVLATADLLSGGIEIKPREEKNFSLEEENIETAFVSVLEEIVFLCENELFLPSKCFVEILDNKYSIDLKGDFLAAEDMHGGTEIKAVTYHRLEVKKIDDKYEVACIFDV